MAQHFVRLIDLPDHDTNTDAIVERLKTFLRSLRAAQAGWPKSGRQADGLVDYEDNLRIFRHAQKLVERRHRANGLQHLSNAERERLRRLLGEVPAVTLAREHRADEIAAALHEDMPWMAPATEAAWDALRRGCRLGEPIRIGPLVLVGPPGIGKTAWAHRLAELLALPACTLDASQGLASFALAGTERGWRTAQPGRPIETMIETRTANPVIVIDELCKAGGLASGHGVNLAFLPSLLGLIEPESARRWQCPFFRVRIDVSHLSWVMTANTVRTLPAPVRNRCRVLFLEDVTETELQNFAWRRGEALGLDAPATEAVVETIARAPELVQRRLSLRDVNRMLERAEILASRPILH